jgi:hypothetical protein
MTDTTRVARVRRTVELDLFRLYLDEIGKHPLLAAEEEVRLSQAYQAGLDARRRLAALAIAATVTGSCTGPQDLRRQ